MREFFFGHILLAFVSSEIFVQEYLCYSVVVLFFREPTIRTLLTYKLAINSSLIHSEDNEECFVAIYMYRSVAAV